MAKKDVDPETKVDAAWWDNLSDDEKDRARASAVTGSSEDYSYLDGEDQPYCEAQVGGFECGRPVERWGWQCDRHDPSGETRTDHIGPSSDTSDSRPQGQR